ncbi:ty3-gypsy retrotransposon protein [Cucumis melo var. makuwa]|uniref:Ty3-gypsy retrotransposon protein n=1 Tax=Cucumis melo var. makuwa TaxID=1194695 RepID=A0A5A7TJY4_CUCMM|nr:ty3-gypsy retrotransposon protein [Cucumis melo var. makuwa]TYK27035.1 ty3-gypsy retrotransposon protein [Cucumis melo var. makuwa]
MTLTLDLSPKATQKRSMQEEEQSSILTKKVGNNLWNLLKTGSSLEGIIIPLFNNYMLAFDLLEKESHLEVVSVMMADEIVEAAMVEMERKINFLMKAIEERDHKIAALKDQIKACETAEPSKTPTAKTDDKGKVVL